MLQKYAKYPPKIKILEEIPNDNFSYIIFSYCG